MKPGQLVFFGSLVVCGFGLGWVTCGLLAGTPGWWGGFTSLSAGVLGVLVTRDFLQPEKARDSESK